MRLTCNLCGKDTYQVLEQGRRAFKLVRCNGCGLISVAPLPSKEFMRRYYHQGYYRHLRQQETQTEKIWAQRLKLIERFQDRGRLLDVGCGCGTFLKLAQRHSWQVQGSEITAYASDYVKERLGIEVYRGELERAPYPEAYFDVITFWHVLEHLVDPLGTLKTARRMLRPGGLLAAATPNVNSYPYRILAVFSKIRRKTFLLFGERQAKELHLYGFSPRTIKMMLAQAGFSTIALSNDISGITWPKRLLDKMANSLFPPLNIDIALSMQVLARKVR